MTEKPPEPEKESKPKKSYKEVKESAGLLESDSDPDDNEVKLIMGFDPDVPVSLQAFNHVSGMIKEHEKRKKARDPETCCTPPLAEDTLWTNLDDDPFGVYTDLGGRSSPTTPPPLRAIKLTYNETAEKIIKALNDVKSEAHKYESTKEIELKEELASHDYAIKKFKNFKSGPVDPEWKPVRRDRPMMPHGHQRLVLLWIFGAKIQRQNISALDFETKQSLSVGAKIKIGGDSGKVFCARKFEFFNFDRGKIRDGIEKNAARENSDPNLMYESVQNC